MISAVEKITAWVSRSFTSHSYVIAQRSWDDDRTNYQFTSNRRWKKYLLTDVFVITFLFLLLLSWYHTHSQWKKWKKQRKNRIERKPSFIGLTFLQDYILYHHQGAKNSHISSFISRYKCTYMEAYTKFFIFHNHNRNKTILSFLGSRYVAVISPKLHDEPVPERYS